MSSCAWAARAPEHLGEHLGEFSRALGSRAGRAAEFVGSRAPGLRRHAAGREGKPRRGARRSPSGDGRTRGAPVASAARGRRPTPLSLGETTPVLVLMRAALDCGSRSERWRTRARGDTSERAIPRTRSQARDAPRRARGRPATHLRGLCGARERRVGHGLRRERRSNRVAHGREDGRPQILRPLRVGRTARRDRRAERRAAPLRGGVVRMLPDETPRGHRAGTLRRRLVNDALPAVGRGGRVVYNSVHRPSALLLASAPPRAASGRPRFFDTASKRDPSVHRTFKRTTPACANAAKRRGKTRPLTTFAASADEVARPSCRGDDVRPSEVAWRQHE